MDFLLAAKVETQELESSQESGTVKRSFNFHSEIIMVRLNYFHDSLPVFVLSASNGEVGHVLE